jgi:hypothetical protein
MDEIENIHQCIDFGEGQKLFKLSASYAQIVMPSLGRRQSCTVRVLDKSGLERSLCVRTHGAWSVDCGVGDNPERWKRHICAHLGDRAYKEPVCASMNIAAFNKAAIL